MSSSRATSHTILLTHMGAPTAGQGKDSSSLQQQPPPGRDNPLGAGRGVEYLSILWTAALLPHLEACGSVKCWG